MDSQSLAAWWANHPASPEWIAKYRASASAPYRAVVVAALGQIAGWHSLYEIGCHCGPMLSAIRAAYPDAALSGCDVNVEAVTEAKQTFPGVTLGAFPGVTAAWPDRCVDVVLSCYSLAYQSPESLPDALREAARLARMAVVICEPTAWEPEQVGYRADGQFGEWRHPYFDALHRVEDFGGWAVTGAELSYPEHYLSGLLIVERPHA